VGRRGYQALLGHKEDARVRLQVHTRRRLHHSKPAHSNVALVRQAQPNQVQHSRPRSILEHSIEMATAPVSMSVPAPVPEPVPAPVPGPGPTSASVPAAVPVPVPASADPPPFPLARIATDIVVVLALLASLYMVGAGGRAILQRRR
jgi:hypothetical protein